MNRNKDAIHRKAGLKSQPRSASVRIRRVLMACAAVAPLAAWPGPSDAVDSQRGRQLFETHCIACHDSWPMTREDRKVQNAADLRKRIGAWAAHSGQDWTPAEIEDVFTYINGRYYRLEQ